MPDVHASAHALPMTIINKSGEVMPARACARISAVATPDPYGNPQFEAIKPDGAEGLYVVNWGGELANNGVGMAYALKDANIVLTEDQVLAIGDVIGPTSGDWSATPTGSGLIFADGPDAAGHSLVIPAGGSGTAAAAVSDCCCACTCIDEGDIEVDGIETTSRWAVRLNEIREVQSNGSLVLPAGEYYLDWSAGNGYWVEDVSAAMTAAYTSGADATGDTTMTGSLILRKNDGGYTTLKLTFTGTVPPE